MFQFQFLLKEVDLELYEHLEISREKTAGGIEPTCRLCVNFVLHSCLLFLCLEIS